MFGQYCDQDLMGEEEEYFDGFCNTSSRKRSKIKKRFSDEQIKSLETIFEAETKLEPRKKLKLAKELGLQPRQVAIWFQNKRARWKSKQLEREYSVLRANYNSLAAHFETLKKEKQSLVVQLKKLNELMGTKGDGSQSLSQDQLPGNSGSMTDNYSENVNSGSETEGKPSLSWVGSDSEQGFFEMEEGADELLTLTSSENWEGLDSKGFLEQSSNSSNCQWWDFWS